MKLNWRVVNHVLESQQSIFFTRAASVAIPKLRAEIGIILYDIEYGNGYATRLVASDGFDEQLLRMKDRLDPLTTCGYIAGALPTAGNPNDLRSFLFTQSHLMKQLKEATLPLIDMRVANAPAGWTATLGYVAAKQRAYLKLDAVRTEYDDVFPPRVTLRDGSRTRTKNVRDVPNGI